MKACEGMRRSAVSKCSVKTGLKTHTTAVRSGALRYHVQRAQPKQYAKDCDKHIAYLYGHTQS